MTHSDAGGGTLVWWPGAATHLANRHGVAMAVPSWRLIRAHGLSVSFTVDGRCKAFAVSAFFLSEAQRNKISYAGQNGLGNGDPRRRLQRRVRAWAK